MFSVRMRGRFPPLHSPLVPLAAFAVITSLPTTQAIDWMSPNELLTELAVYQSLVAALVGLLCWESIISFPFEWCYYTRQRAWKHGMTAYIIVRYGTWIHLISVLVNIHATTNIDCEASMVVLLVTLSLATLATSLIFVVRCIAVWKRNRYVTCGLGLLWLVTAFIHLSSATRLKSIWTSQGCQSVFVRPMWEFNMAYVLIQTLDTLTFGLSAWGLRVMRKQGFGKILFGQACVFIGITATLNLACMILVYLNPNPLLTYLLSPVAVTISGILACKSFRDLQAHSLRTCTITDQSGPSWRGSIVKPPPSPGSTLPSPSSAGKEHPAVGVNKSRALGKRPKSNWLTNTGLGDDDEDILEMAVMSTSLPVASTSSSRTVQPAHANPCCSIYATSLARFEPKLSSCSTGIPFGGSTLSEEEHEVQRKPAAAVDQQGTQQQRLASQGSEIAHHAITVHDSSVSVVDGNDKVSPHVASMGETGKGRNRSNTFGIAHQYDTSTLATLCNGATVKNGINDDNDKSRPNTALTADGSTAAPNIRPSILRARVVDRPIRSDKMMVIRKANFDAGETVIVGKGTPFSDTRSKGDSPPCMTPPARLSPQACTADLAFGNKSTALAKVDDLPPSRASSRTRTGSADVKGSMTTHHSLNSAIDGSTEEFEKSGLAANPVVSSHREIHVD